MAFELHQPYWLTGNIQILYHRDDGNGKCIMDNGSAEKKTEILNGIEMYKDESIQYAQMADSSKP